jgi:hypothetical protein
MGLDDYGQLLQFGVLYLGGDSSNDIDEFVMLKNQTLFNASMPSSDAISLQIIILKIFREHLNQPHSSLSSEAKNLSMQSPLL